MQMASHSQGNWKNRKRKKNTGQRKSVHEKLKTGQRENRKNRVMLQSIQAETGVKEIKKGESEGEKEREPGERGEKVKRQGVPKYSRQ